MAGCRRGCSDAVPKLTDTYFSLIMPTVATGFGVFLLLQRYFVQGIALTGLKG